MHIDPIAYMEWAKLHAEAKINLTRSGLADCSLADFDLDRAELDINGDHSYGYPPLIEAIAQRYEVEEKNIITVNGASQAIFFICAALLEPGDEVLVEKPAYEPLLAVPRFFNSELKRVERRFQDGYQIDLDRFRSSLSPRTRLVILTNPHNPSGVLVSPALIKDLAGAAGKEGALVLIDEIYLEFLQGDERKTSFHLAENLVIVSSLTKVYGLGGLRCGWILAPSFLIDRLRRLFDYVSVEGVFIGEQVAAKLFSRLDALAARNWPVLEQNFVLVQDFLRQERALSWVEPSPGIICFPRIEGGTDGTQLARLLRERYETAVVPGHFFEEPKHFRLGFGVATDMLAQGLENIRAALRSL